MTIERVMTNMILILALVALGACGDDDGTGSADEGGGGEGDVAGDPDTGGEGDVAGDPDTGGEGDVAGDPDTGGEGDGDSAGDSDAGGVGDGDGNGAANTDPVASFTMNPGCTDSSSTEVTFTSTSTDADDDALSCSWTFMSGTPATSSDCTVEGVTFPSVGLYSVTLTVDDGNGGTDSTTQMIGPC